MKTHDYNFGTTIARYTFCNQKNLVGLTLLPSSMADKVADRRKLMQGIEVDGLTKALSIQIPAWELESLAQIKVVGDAYSPAFAQGISMRNSATSAKLKFRKQETIKNGKNITIRTCFIHENAWTYTHELTWREGAPFLSSATIVENSSGSPITIEMLASFSLWGITPFAKDDHAGRLILHRFRSFWCMEGRHEAIPFEELQLENSWANYGVRCERFGSIGSMPVKKFFPFVAIEDTENHVLWGATLAHPGSWQMEIYRRSDIVSLSGGIADREFGHWTKTLQPGQSFRSPTAFLACVQGETDELCNALLAAQTDTINTLPPPEHELPVVFNEWCTSWGNPTHENLIAIAKKLKDSGIKYLVIDDGWAERPGKTFQQNGDWIVNKKSFPNGLKAVCDEIRAYGMIPGIWFEFENLNEGCRAWTQTTHQLTRDGIPIQCGNRRFWDFRDPWVHDYLAERVINLLRDNNFGYLKVDYNDTIGIGVDGAESLGEGLRQHLEGVQNFFRRIRRELPHLVIENCSSGGHRLEPSMMALTSMGSFSDAHECLEIPIIAANLQRLILPRQSQIWAVIRADESQARTAYSIAAGFLGRLCISGEIHKLSEEKMTFLRKSVALYRKTAHIIANGRSFRYGPPIISYRYPKGWQSVLRISQNGNTALFVAHTFANYEQPSIEIPLPKGKWQIVDSLEAEGKSPVLSASGNSVVWQAETEWRGTAALLERVS